MGNRGEHSWNDRAGEPKLNSQNKTRSMITMNTNTKTKRYDTGRNRHGNKSDCGERKETPNGETGVKQNKGKRAIRIVKSNTD